MILCGSLFALAAVFGPAEANEVPYIVSIDGRPLDATHPGARERGGRLYINVVRAVRAFNGLLTFAPSETRVLVGDHTLIYHAGKTTAEEDDQSITLMVPPFMENGDMFVPLPSFAAFVDATVTVDRDRHRVDLSPEKNSSVAPTPTGLPSRS